MAGVFEIQTFVWQHRVSIGIGLIELTEASGAGIEAVPNLTKDFSVGYSPRKYPRYTVKRIKNAPGCERFLISLRSCFFCAPPVPDQRPGAEKKQLNHALLLGFFRFFGAPPCAESNVYAVVVFVGSTRAVRYGAHR